jgi:hypothetical protein
MDGRNIGQPTEESSFQNEFRSTDHCGLQVGQFSGRENRVRDALTP